MACILRSECNFLNGYFRCLILIVKMMRGIHTFRMDRMSEITKCNPWSTKLYPYPSLTWKMETYLELEGKLGPKPGPNPKPSHHQAPAFLPKVTTP